MMQAFHDRLVRELGRRRFPMMDEKSLQHEIEQALVSLQIFAEREVPCAGGIIDFFTGPRVDIGEGLHDTSDGRPATRGTWPPLGAIGIEVKIKGAKRDIFHQCEGYCADPRIARLVVVAGLPIALPSIIGGKPVTIVNISRAWL